MRAATAPPASSGSTARATCRTRAARLAYGPPRDLERTQIGALGISLGGGAVWNALTSGVPFKAAVPIITWTNLLTALAPHGLSKSGLVQ